MGYMTDGLTFNTLRRASRKRLPLFKNAKGEAGKTVEWTPAQWLQAIIGELGEYANLRKKIERGDFTLEDVKSKIADEIADVVIYIDILADKLGIDLGEAVMKKWNETSKRVGVPLYIDAEDWHYDDRGTGLSDGDL